MKKIVILTLAIIFGFNLSIAGDCDAARLLGESTRHSSSKLRKPKGSPTSSDSSSASSSGTSRSTRKDGRGRFDGLKRVLRGLFTTTIDVNGQQVTIPML